MSGPYAAGIDLFAPFGERVTPSRLQISMETGGGRRDSIVHVTLIVFGQLAQTLAMDAQAFFGLDFSAFEVAQQSRDALKMRRQAALGLGDGSLQELMPNRIQRRTYFLRQICGNAIGAAVHLRGVRIQDGFEPGGEW